MIVALWVLGLNGAISGAQGVLATWGLSEYERVRNLLMDEAVMEAIALTPDQKASIQKVYSTAWDEIPLVSNLLERSQHVDWATRYELLAEADRQASQFKLNQIAALLAPEQWQFVERLMLKEKGLVIILENSDVRGKLGLTEAQLEKMRGIVATYSPLLEGLNRRLGRQQIAGLHSDEDMGTRIREVECLKQVIDALKADMNRDLRTVLTEFQSAQWDEMIQTEKHREDQGWPEK